MEEALARLKALADGNRLRVAFALLGHPELCVCQITSLLGIATPTVSRHMSILHGAGIVESRKDGRWVFYRLHASFPSDLGRWLRDALASSDMAMEDRETLASILSCSPRDLCKSQRASNRSKAPTRTEIIPGSGAANE